MQTISASWRKLCQHLKWVKYGCREMKVHRKHFSALLKRFFPVTLITTSPDPERNLPLGRWILPCFILRVFPERVMKNPLHSIFSMEIMIFFLISEERRVRMYDS